MPFFFPLTFLRLLFSMRLCCKNFFLVFFLVLFCFICFFPLSLSLFPPLRCCTLVLKKKVSSFFLFLFEVFLCWLCRAFSRKESEFITEYCYCFFFSCEYCYCLFFCSDFVVSFSDRLVSFLDRLVLVVCLFKKKGRVFFFFRF